jgi:hypothetical protein
MKYGPWEKKYDALCGPEGSRKVLGGGQMEHVAILGNIEKGNTNV